jgi:hypothetical protein
MAVVEVIESDRTHMNIGRNKDFHEFRLEDNERKRSAITTININFMISPSPFQETFIIQCRILLLQIQTQLIEGFLSTVCERTHTID